MWRVRTPRHPAPIFYTGSRAPGFSPSSATQLCAMVGESLHCFVLQTPHYQLGVRHTDKVSGLGTGEKKKKLSGSPTAKDLSVLE